MMITLTIRARSPESLALAMEHARQRFDIQRESFNAKLTIRIDKELNPLELQAQLNQVPGVQIRIDQE